MDGILRLLYIYELNEKFKTTKIVKEQLLKGLCNWFFFFIFRLKIVSREEKVEKKIQKNQQIVEKNEK